LQQWVDPAKRAKLEADENLSASFPGYDPDLFPFTKDAFERFCEWATVDPRNAKPSEIIARLNHVTAQAYRGDPPRPPRRIVDRNLLSDLGIS
jgi:hypothetical protein